MYVLNESTFQQVFHKASSINIHDGYLKIRVRCKEARRNLRKHFHTFSVEQRRWLAGKLEDKCGVRKSGEKSPTTPLTFHFTSLKFSITQHPPLFCGNHNQVTSHLILMFKCRRSMGGLQKVSKVCSCS